MDILYIIIWTIYTYFSYYKVLLMQKEQVVLVYPLKEVESTEEIPIKFGGKPVWMYDPKIESYECTFCKNPITFLCQIFAPLNEDHTYNRAFYIFFCQGQKCQNSKKAFQVFRMQLSETDKLIPFQDQNVRYKVLKEEYYAETDIIGLQQLKSIGQRVLKQLNENQQGDDDQDSDFQDSKPTLKNSQLINAEEDMQGIEEIADNKKTDPIFEIYKGTLSKLNYPVVIYSSQPLQFKDQHINVSQKRCSNCKGLMKFQFQLNSCLLENFQQLVNYDWGTIRVYTCKVSCKGQPYFLFKQDVEIQIEEDTALNKQEILKKLQEIQRERKKKEAKKQKKKEKRKQRKQKKEQNKQKTKDQKDEQQQSLDSEQGDGDWD